MPNERQLSDVLSEFASTMLTDFPIQGILDHLVQRIVQVMPITAAGVTLFSPGFKPRHVAASDASALRFEELQTELGEGPCVEAYRSGKAVEMPDLRSDDRFPKFTPRALSVGLAAVFTFPLRHGSSQLGALDLYSDTAGALDAPSFSAAQTLADVVVAYLLNAQARRDLQDAADRSQDRSMHDELTGLANRTLLLDRLEHAVQRSRRSEKALGVLFVDLDQFKLVNDSYGHDVGDELLVAVARRLSALLRPDDSLARMSGDEFVVLCENLNGESDLSLVASRISEALRTPYTLSTNEVNVTASIGVAFAGRGIYAPTQLIRDADAAMYLAKRNGGNRHQVVDLREVHFFERRHTLKRELAGAIARGELLVQHQPIVTTKDGQIIGVEALLRWAHDGRQDVAPIDVVKLAEESGLITEIGRWVLEQACNDRHRWQRDDRARDVGVAVNVSAQQLLSPDFSATVAAVLRSTKTAPGLLTIELTETVLLQDSHRALAVFEQLKKLGVLLALDDFGTGYSSLSYLKQFPVDIVKIDQSFIADLESDQASRSIVTAVIDLARVMGIATVAEGVENAAQHGEVTALGCDFCQGFYFAQPMPASEFDVLMQLGDLSGNRRLPYFAT
jgi:diguanylate cyclase (GGDEF)-like protein